MREQFEKWVTVQFRERKQEVRASPGGARVIEERVQRCGCWWRGKDVSERFLLYYTCLRYQLVGDEVYIAALAEFKAANAEFDEAFAKEAAKWLRIN